MSRQRFTAIERRRERFIKKYGRPPGPNDTSFIKAMAKAGVDAMYIYGFWRTGILILTAYDGDWLSGDKLKVWDAAICEYMDFTEDGYVDKTRLM